MLHQTGGRFARVRLQRQGHRPRRLSRGQRALATDTSTIDHVQVQDFYQDLQKFFALLPHFVRGVDAAVLVVSRAFQDELPPVDLVDPSAGVGLLDAISAFGTSN